MQKNYNNFIDVHLISVKCYPSFSQTHKIIVIAIIANFVFPNIYNFLLYLHHVLLVYVK